MMATKMQLFARLRSAVASFTGILSGVSTAYNITNPRRKVVEFNRLRAESRATANSILTQSLPAIRAYCRQTERNSSTARAAVEGLVALIVGTGIDLVPDTGDEDTDERIRAEWERLKLHADVDGRDLWTIQQEACRDMIVAGEALWRFVVDPDIVAPGDVPLRVLPLESEWLIDGVPDPGKDAITAVAGITLDRYGRPVRYALQNPAGGDTELVPADQICHVFERRRALQARGESWFVTVLETIINEQALIDAELCAAEKTAAMAMVITSPQGLPVDDDSTDIDPTRGIRLGGVAALLPGEQVQAFSHTRPSQQIAPFRQMLRGDIAAAMRLPQRFLDRDVSRANYSSMRADMQDTERLLAPVREWFGHQTAGRLYRRALPFLALRAGIPVPRADYRLLPDVQPYVDPLKDVNATIASINAGLTTYEAEISKRGGEYLKTWAQAQRERDQLAAMGLPFAPQSQQEPAVAVEPSETTEKSQ